MVSLKYFRIPISVTIQSNNEYENGLNMKILHIF